MKLRIRTYSFMGYYRQLDLDYRGVSLSSNDIIHYRWKFVVCTVRNEMTLPGVGACIERPDWGTSHIANTTAMGT